MIFGLFRKNTKPQAKQDEDVSGLVPVRSEPVGSASDLIKSLNENNDRLASSGIYEAFNPRKPVSSSDFLVGRGAELNTCIQSLMSPGNNVLMYGDRGVGKSSIGYVICGVFNQLTSFKDYKVLIYRCDVQDDLKSIFSGPLRACGHDVTVREVKDSESSSIEGKFEPKIDVIPGIIGASLGSVGGESRLGTTQIRTGAETLAQSASWIADQIADAKIILFLDEMDKIESDDVKKSIATVVKHVSDHPGSKFKFLLAGIAQNGAELTAGHPSVQRCLTEVAIDRMHKEDLMEVLSKGEKIVKIATPEGEKPLLFANKIKQEIAHMSFGYPYFTHLIALAAATRAVQTGDAHVDEKFELDRAIDDAVNGAEKLLKKSLEYAIATDSGGQYRKLLIAAAEYRADFLSAAEWRTAYQVRWGEVLSQGKFAPYLRRLVADRSELAEWKAKGVDPVFVREKSGLYRFYDARMPSFIRLALSGAVNRLATVAARSVKG